MLAVHLAFDVMTRFPLGKPILAMTAIALVAGAAIVARPVPAKKDLTLWVFADLHADTYRSIIDQFERETGKTVDVQLLNAKALPMRLESMFMAGTRGAPLPDLVEVESSWVGRFFRPPVEEIGFLPLDEYLRRGGWDRRVIPSRLASWSKRGIVFGVPHDVHPVTITYRKDLFDEAGVDLASAKTWPEFHAKCVAFQSYWRGRGYVHRRAMEMPLASADYVTIMLLQRGVNLLDDRENIYLTDPRVAQTIAFYARLVAGPNAIASESAGGTGIWTKDALDGNFCAFMTADWRVYQIRTYAPQLAGKLRMMPLPKFDPTDLQTSTWGGTMIGITKNSPHHDDAWRLIEFLYFSEVGLRARQRVTDILPPVIAQWDDPAYHQPDPFFGGQKVGELFVDLARQIPTRYMSPATPIAWTQLSVILNRATAYLEEHGEAGLEERCRDWCEEAAADLKMRIEHERVNE
jgi:arabinosaccharide transport system substrate-binding protein